jgi:hypothetical protein
MIENGRKSALKKDASNFIEGPIILGEYRPV